MDVTFYCPDRHILYDGRLPYRQGVGGGITSRIRMARALRRAGHRVKMVVNCPKRARIDGVEYLPLAEVGEIRGDVLIFNTSGGGLDLSPAHKLDIDVGLRWVWTSGTMKPTGLDQLSHDFVYAKSNFLRDVVEREWGVAQERIFVAYNGFEEEVFRRAERRTPPRDRHRLVYFSHPSKGLDTAIAILGELRAREARYHLVVCGGAGLWGQEESVVPQTAGVAYRGLIGQRELAVELLRSTFSLSLQARLEPFGMVITEAMRAGCIVLASPVGAYAELIRDGEDGFIVPGDHQSESVRRQAAELIVALESNPGASGYVRRNAQHVIWDTDTMVRVWEGHWEWWFRKQSGNAYRALPAGMAGCPHCGGGRLWLADGYHCLVCGRYQRLRSREGAQVSRIGS